jgi:hypothetical protein
MFFGSFIFDVFKEGAKLGWFEAGKTKVCFKFKKIKKLNQHFDDFEIIAVRINILISETIHLYKDCSKFTAKIHT